MANDANGSTADDHSEHNILSDKPDAENNTNAITDPASYANAHFVRSTVATRRAYYALTPIVAAFNSGDVGAQAVAGLGSAICKVPPVMICNPQETGGNTSFNPRAFVGKGLELVSVGNGTAPGCRAISAISTRGGGSNGANRLEKGAWLGNSAGRLRRAMASTQNQALPTSDRCDRYALRHL